LLFPFFAIFYLVKKLIRFLGNSAIRHYLLAWRHFPPDPPFRQLLLAFGKSTIKPSPDIRQPQKYSSGFMYSQAMAKIIENSFADYCFLL